MFRQLYRWICGLGGTEQQAVSPAADKDGGNEQRAGAVEKLCLACFCPERREWGGTEEKG